MEIEFKLNLSFENEVNKMSFNIYDKNIEEIFDTYYFALDNNYMPNDESHKKTILTIKYYLEILIKKVKGLKKEQKPLLFPIDFSDEYIGFLIITKKEDDFLNINYGLTTKLQGYSYAPTNFTFFDQNMEVESIENWDYKINQDIFIDDIKNSISKIFTIRNLEIN